MKNSKALPAKEPDPEGPVTDIRSLEGDFCKNIHLHNRFPNGGSGSGDISPSDASDLTPDGPFANEFNTDGPFCETPIPFADDISTSSSESDADVASFSSLSPVTEISKPDGGFCKELNLKNQNQNQIQIQNQNQNAEADGISNSSSSSSSSSSPDADVALSSVFSCGFASEIGSRVEMEDFVAAVRGFVTVSGETYDFFAVYDGHGSAEVAEFCRDRMHAVVAEELLRSPPPTAAVAGAATGSEVQELWARLMERSFERVDAEVAGMEKGVGSTAVVAIVGPRSIVVANCGDSRAVMWRDGKDLALSSDHKPDREDERERIEKTPDGWVANWHGYRVLGVLATSRSIGDYDLKPYVISKPELTVTSRREKDEFLILASDGLWDLVPNESACRVVRNCLTGRLAKKYPEAVRGHDADTAAALLARVALSMGSTDNISVVVVQLTNMLKSACAEDAVGLFCSSA